jgi:hypothetical protein
MDLTGRYLFLILLTSITAIALFPCDARADEEGRMPLSHLQLDSKGLDNSGPVHVEATQSERGIGNLSVSAFGRNQALTPAQLASLSGKTFNSIALTYSRGYPNTGGRNVFLLLCQGFSSGVKVIAVVTVTENGGIRIDVGKIVGQ